MFNSEYEQMLIKENIKQKNYEYENNILKEPLFVYASGVKLDNPKLNINVAKLLVKADLIARTNRKNNKNVYFHLLIDDLNKDLFELAIKENKTIDELGESILPNYLKIIQNLDISIPQDKIITYSDIRFKKFTNRVFNKLKELNLIKQEYGDIVYLKDYVYQENEYEKKDNNYYDLDGNLLNKREGNIVYLDLSRPEIVQTILKDSKLEPYLGYKERLFFDFKMTNGDNIKIKIDNPEYFFGISYVVINPNKYDFFKYAAKEDLESLNYTKYLYSGIDLINPFNEYQIPVYLSKDINEPIYLGIPSLEAQAENFIDEFDLPYLGIIDYIAGEKVLIDSLFLNGYNLLDAKNIMIEKACSLNIGEYKPDYDLKKINITSPYDFGIKINLDNGLSDVFFSSIFLDGVAILASILADNIGFLNINYPEALNQISRFNSPNYLCFLNQKEHDYRMIIFNIILEALFKKSLEISSISSQEEMLDEDGNLMNYKNNNIPDLYRLIKDNSASLLRLYYISNLDNPFFKLKKISSFDDLVNYLIHTFDLITTEDNLDYDFINFKIQMLRLLDNNDYQNYFKELIRFFDLINEEGKLSLEKAKTILVFLSILAPSLADYIALVILKLKNPTIYYSWDL